jgi:hypothetical protein
MLEPSGLWWTEDAYHPMLEMCTTEQLLDFRSLYASTLERAIDWRERTDALMLLKQIDEELAIRKKQQSA